MIPIWRGGTLSLIARLGFRVGFFPFLPPFNPPKLTEYNILYHMSEPPILPLLIHSHDSFLTSMHATPAQALQMHVDLRARHSLAMHFATFAGSDYEALEPIVELEQAKRAMEMVTGAADRQGGNNEGEGKGEGERVVSVGEWWMEGGMGVIDIGETGVVHVGKTPPSQEPSEDHRTAVQ
jgi:N-acyl-phosphatidylethanolamine-hydrolysing phospholipase D